MACRPSGSAFIYLSEQKFCCTYVGDPRAETRRFNILTPPNIYFYKRTERGNMAASLLARSTFLYLGSVNIGTAVLFAYDKHQATQHSPRISERRLCQTALLGGWPAGLLAMQLFRHKTKKKSFQRKYVESIGTNAIAAVPLGIALWASPPVRSAFMRDFAKFVVRRTQPPRWGGGRKPPRMRR